MSRMTSPAMGLFAFLFLTSSAGAQIVDPPGDTSAPCVDIVQGDVRADRTTLTVSIHVAGGFCPQAHYFLHIDNDLDGESNIALQTKFDGKGRASTTGSPSLVAQVDRSHRTITWRVPLAEVEGPADPNPNHIRVWFRTVRTCAQDRLPDSGALDFRFGGTAAGIIGPAGGTVTVSDSSSPVAGASLTLPAGAISEVTTISISPASTAPSFSDGSHAVAAVDIEPSGLQFAVAASLTLQYRESDLDPLYSLGEDTLNVFSMDSSVGAWLALPTEPVDTRVKRVTTNAVRHLSPYALKDAKLSLLCGVLRNPEHLPVLLVHGWQPLTVRGIPTPLCGWGTGDTWGQLADLLGQKGYAVCEMNYATGVGIEDNAVALRRAVEKLRDFQAQEGGVRPGGVTVVTHSMGGLVARYAIENLRPTDTSAPNPEPIQQLVTLATPHLGTNTALFGCENVLQMRPESDFLLGLNNKIRPPNRVPALRGCGTEYYLYVGNSDFVVERESALANEWVYFSNPDTATELRAQPLFESPSISPDRRLKAPPVTRCGPDGADPCGHTGSDGIANVQDERHAMWPEIQAIAASALWFPEGSAPQCNAACWAQLSPPAAPSGRIAPGLAYDSLRGQLLLFGGGLPGNGSSGETWVWDGLSWSLGSPATSPPARDSHAMAFDARRGEIVLFGGSDVSDRLLADTWVWDGTTWAQRLPATSPAPRTSAAMVFDERLGQVVLFGGNAGADFLDDTWVWDGTTWTKLLPPHHPSGRAIGGFGMAYHAARSEAVLFGGNRGATWLADTWVWDGSDWVQKSPASSPASRNTSMAYDASRSEVVLFGGAGEGATYFGDTWVWDGTTWRQQTCSTNPIARVGNAIGYDATRGQLLLFGGNDSGGQFLADSWVAPLK